MKSAVGQQRELRWGDGYGVQWGDKTIVRLLAFITQIQQVMRPTRFDIRSVRIREIDEVNQIA